MATKIKKKTLLLGGLLALGIISVIQAVSSLFGSLPRTSTLSQNQLRDLLVINRAAADVPGSGDNPSDNGSTGNTGVGECPSPAPCK